MPTFGRYSKNQFGSAIVAGMGAGVNAFQQLHLYVDSENRKQLSHFSAASYSDASPVATADRLYRVIICTGFIQPNYEAVTLLDLSPIANTLTLPGASRVFLDQVYKGSIEIDFDEPIRVEKGEILNIIMGLSYANGDNIVTPSTSIGRLAWQGWEGENKTSEFPYRLR